MIESFRCRKTCRLFTDGVANPKWRSFERVARRKLDMIDAAARLGDLKVPPGNRLEALKGNRKGQYSIRINDQIRICFVWRRNAAHNVEIVDYH